MRPTTTWRHYRENKRIFIPGKDDEKGMMLFFSKSTVTVDCWGVEVVFTKTNRGAYYHDSRQPKKMFSGDEVYAELIRMCETPEDALRAMKKLRMDEL